MRLSSRFSARTLDPSSSSSSCSISDLNRHVSDKSKSYQPDTYRSYQPDTYRDDTYREPWLVGSKVAVRNLGLPFRKSEAALVQEWVD